MSGMGEPLQGRPSAVLISCRGMNMDFGLENRVVLITGAAQGIGRETAKLFSREGCRIAIVDKNLELGQSVANEIGSEGRESFAIECDVSNTQSVVDAVGKVRRVFGGIDVLVNNAGVGPPFLGKRIVEMPEEHWDRMIAVHLRGTFLFTKYTAPLMVARRWGRIINIGSIHGISGGRLGFANYASAKAGVECFTKASSLEFAPSGVTVNCVAPGYTKTPMLSLGPEMESLMARQTPVGRLAEPADIAVVIVFLASHPASHITGATVRVDGGRAFYTF
ncbi:MAG: hypothetical protein CVU64_03945 [Deltaproteobacteria bacterium HGW-Deltaproteobacteria-21]|nr:MAG: hypothetical protein CVU64_03945 [Deltaproteobacteria bacterium HGW-Deltaproteobacteria-21]